MLSCILSSCSSQIKLLNTVPDYIIPINHIKKVDVKRDVIYLTEEGIAAINQINFSVGMRISIENFRLSAYVYNGIDAMLRPMVLVPLLEHSVLIPDGYIIFTSRHLDDWGKKKERKVFERDFKKLYRIVKKRGI